MNAAVRFFDLGVGVFPIVTPGKTPRCKSWDDYVCSRDEAARFRNYGVRLGPCRLGWLGVADTDNPGAESWAASNLPPTPLTVITGRGIHRYYRIAGDAPKFIYRAGHTIEFRNTGQYVVGPGSVHQSGTIYTAANWSWRWDDLPLFPAAFDFGAPPAPAGGGQLGDGFEFPSEVRAGARHHELFRLLRSLRGLGADQDVARGIVHDANQNRCIPPLPEGADFERWFQRGWNTPDRPFTPGIEIPDLPADSGPDVDLDAVDLGGF